MGWFRSEEMEYVQIIVHENSAHACIAQLGSLGSIQFADRNGGMTHMQRCKTHRIFSFFLKEMRHCDDMERTLRFFENEMQKFDIVSQPKSVERFLQDIHEPRGAAPSTYVFDELKTMLQHHREALEHLNTFCARLAREMNEKIELKHVLRKCSEFYRVEMLDGSPAESKNDVQRLLDHPAEREVKFRLITGVVPRDDIASFTRLAFRATRGNCFTHFSEIEEVIRDPDSEAEVEKSVFVILFHSERVEAKLVKICEAFGARQYEVPDMDNVGEIGSLIRDTAIEIEDRKQIIAKNREKRRSLLRGKIAKHIVLWEWQLKREKAIYHTLNMFTPNMTNAGDGGASGGAMGASGASGADGVGGVGSGGGGGSSSGGGDGSMPIGEGGGLKELRDKTAMAIRDASAATGQDAPCMITPIPVQQWPRMPPTHFNTNKVTEVFQGVVDTYGVPRYREANPAMSTAVTFPFLFGIMFGDVGHGLLLACAGIYLVANEKAFLEQKGKMGELVEMLFGGRYLILLMGIFAVYAGFIYNDTFSLGMNLFGARWEWSEAHNGTNVTAGSSKAKVARHTGDKAVGSNVYPFGLDPTWHSSDNELSFFNSFKMKLAVIIGVTQMTYGLVLRCANAIYFRDMLELFFEAIPMLVFLLSLFGYMIFLIVFKWCQDWDVLMSQGKEPPSLINVLIGIALSPGAEIEPRFVLFEGQGALQTFLLLIAFISVPIMWIVKPVVIHCRKKSAAGPGHGAKKGGYARVDGRTFDDEAEETKLFVGEPDTPHNASDFGAISFDDEGRNGRDQGPGDHGNAHGNAHGGDDDDDDEEDHGFGEAMIHQTIETIEFVLGVISNTASYLRLWALSLAHAELAQVFWNLTLVLAINQQNFFLVFCAYPVFAAITFGVLLLMDGASLWGCGAGPWSVPRACVRNDLSSCVRPICRALMLPSSADTYPLFASPFPSHVPPFQRLSAFYMPCVSTGSSFKTSFSRPMA